MKKKMSVLLIVALLAFAIPAHALTWFYSGRKTVTSAGTRVPLVASSLPFTHLDICALYDNTNAVTVGGADVVGAAATRKGVYLNAGDCYSINPTLTQVGDASNVYIDSITSGEGVTFVSYMEER